MTKINVGERVFHYRHGKGVVTKLIAHDLADVQFEKTSEYLERRNLISLDEFERESIRRKEAAARIAAQRDARENYIREQEQSRRNKENLWAKFRPDVRELLETDFINSKARFEILDPTGVVADEFERERISFVRSWIDAFARKNGNDKFQLDDQQIAAIAAINGHVQVVARAGSGKTTTLVARAFFLLGHCRVDAHEILILAFNRKAANEIRKKLLISLNSQAESAIDADTARRLHEAKSFKGRLTKEEAEASAVSTVAASLNVELPYVMTFHALANAIVHPNESLLYDDANSDEQKLSRAFQCVIDDHLQEPGFKLQIRNLMLTHFREDWEKIVAGRYDQSKEELLSYRRYLPKQSLAGEYVKSYGEKVIADFLFEHAVPYKYERNHFWNGNNYRPDFTVFKSEIRGKPSGVIIEYFGLKGDPAYDTMTDDKREYWKTKEGWELIELFPSEVAGERSNFEERLKRSLELKGIPCIKLSEDEIWERIKDRAIDRYTKATVGFIGRCRKLSISPENLQDRIDAHSPLIDCEDLFLNLAKQLYLVYLDRLKVENEEDFDGLMQRASNAVNSGTTLFKRKSESGELSILRYLFIDEFQDFSDLFFRVLQAIKTKNPTLELFCVGDDWQAINGFAGSDLKFFQEFKRYIGPSRALHISTNYRSKKSIVEIGNSLMKMLGSPAITHKQEHGDVFRINLSSFKPSVVEQQRHVGDIITPVVCRIVQKVLSEGSDVVLLARKNSLPWYVNNIDAKTQGSIDLDRYLHLIRSFFPKSLREKITISTAHKYKGLEKQAVIVLDAVERCYPLVHPDWVFSRIIGESPSKIVIEERRLLYVALTRAIDTLYVVTDEDCTSLFLAELESRKLFREISWSDHPPVGAMLNRRLIVRVSNAANRDYDSGTYAISESLKARAYRWDSVKKYWEKSFLIQGFDLENLTKEDWPKAADCVVVEIFDESEKLGASYSLTLGKWACQIDRMDEVILAHLNADSNSPVLSNVDKEGKGIK